MPNEKTLRAANEADAAYLRGVEDARRESADLLRERDALRAEVHGLECRLSGMRVALVRASRAADKAEGHRQSGLELLNRRELERDEARQQRDALADVLEGFGRKSDDGQRCFCIWQHDCNLPTKKHDERCLATRAALAKAGRHE